MKQGDKFEVKIEGQVVAHAEVREVGDGQVTLVVPGTIVVMATSTGIAPAQPAVPAPVQTEHQILGVDNTSAPVENSVVPNASASAGDTPVVPAPPVTAPSEPAPATQDAAQQSVEQVVEAQPETTPTVSNDNGQPQATDSGNTDVPQQ